MTDSHYPNQAEQALQASEERFRQVVNSLSAHIYVTEFTVSGERINRYLSPNVEKLTGYPPEKFLNDWQSWTSVGIHPEDRALAIAQSERLAQGQNSQAEYRMIRADGQVIWVRDSARVEREGSSNVVYGLVSDITERKQTERSLQRYAVRLETLHQIDKAILAAKSPSEIAQVALHYLHRLIPYDRAGVGFIDVVTNELNMLAIQAENPSVDLTGSPLPWPTLEFIRERLQQEQRVIVEEGATLALSEQGEHLAEAGISKYVIIPLLRRRELIGILGLGFREPDSFSTDHQEVAIELADQLAIAIHNANLIEAERQAIEKERQRLARDLHDVVSQNLFSASVIAETLPRLWERKPEQVRQSLGELHQLTRGALAEMRTLLFDLRPESLAKANLAELLSQLSDALMGRTQVTVKLELDTPISLPAEVKINLYRLTQEALNNIAKHARASQVDLSLKTGAEQVVLTIHDNGKGYDPSQIPTGHLGLGSMQERAEAIGAALQIVSQPGYGTTVTVIWPQSSSEAKQ